MRSPATHLNHFQPSPADGSTLAGDQLAAAAGAVKETAMRIRLSSERKEHIVNLAVGRMEAFERELAEEGQGRKAAAFKGDNAARMVFDAASTILGGEDIAENLSRRIFDRLTLQATQLYDYARRIDALAKARTA